MPRILNSSSPAPKNRELGRSCWILSHFQKDPALLENTGYRTLRHSQTFLGISVSRAGAQNGWLNRNVFFQRGYIATLSLKALEEDACLPLPSF